MVDERARDRGQAAVTVVLVATALLGASLLGVVEVGTRLVERTRAQTAADASALAALGGGESAARRVAAANGAELIAFVVAGDQVTVTVRVGDAGASARATDGP